MRWLWVVLGAVAAAAVGVWMWLRAHEESPPYDAGPTTLHRETLRPGR